MSLRTDFALNLLHGKVQYLSELIQFVVLCHDDANGRMKRNVVIFTLRPASALDDLYLFALISINVVGGDRRNRLSAGGACWFRG
ncbi:hypothetical protein AB835_10085 [Candidatus Endobugula sertula]|uniref:Uncharacterized protein n=1 Tax=Candidatus Endobugula sertula TaxID=62101 RepID=A0A1D2QNP1_9GAMM|nr:hypothetical protein AB835_10085 [Candidatus Endobugula sertula]